MPTPLPVLAGVYLGSIIGSWEGLPSTNRFCFKQAGTPLGAPIDASNAQAVSNALIGNWHDVASVALDGTYVTSEAKTYALGSPLVPAQVSPGAVAGGSLGTTAQASTAGLIAHHVDRRGRGSQSRTFLTPMSSGSITSDGKATTGTYQTLVNNGFNTFITAVLTNLNTASPSGSWEYVQLSNPRPRVGFPPPVPGTFLITASITENLLSTQRRRTRRNGG